MTLTNCQAQRNLLIRDFFLLFTCRLAQLIKDKLPPPTNYSFAYCSTKANVDRTLIVWWYVMLCSGNTLCFCALLTSMLSNLSILFTFFHHKTNVICQRQIKVNILL